MAKVTISLLATFAILLIAVDASIVRTTVTTTEIEDENPQYSQRCQQQIQQQDLSHCERFIQSQSRRRGYYSSAILLRGGEEENQQGREHLDQCCQQLRRVDQQCRCDALEEIVRQWQQRGEVQGRQELREVARTAEQIPNMCRMERPRSCQISQGGRGGGWF